jgi:hypothetical protein
MLSPPLAAIYYGYSEGFFSRLGLGFEPKSFRKGGFDLNTISKSASKLLLSKVGKTLMGVQVSQRSTLRLEVGMTLLSPLALSTRLIRLD